jgi:hypothetical protein
LIFLQKEPDRSFWEGIGLVGEPSNFPSQVLLYKRTKNRKERKKEEKGDYAGFGRLLYRCL